jgi:hypothetical protein
MTSKKVSNLFQDAAAAVSRAAGQAGDFLESLGPDPSEKEPVGQRPAPIQRKVMLVNYSPRIKSEQGKKLWEVMGWNDPDKLVTGHIGDLKTVSHGYANYQVVERHEVDKVPAKVDGFSYDPDQFVKNLRASSGFHQPDAVDYYPIVKEFDILNKVKSGAVDEVWLFAFPYAGFYESIMGGPEPFWCNAPPLERTEAAGRRFVIMGYNYQRGLGEMLENLGHRAESILEHAWRHKQGDANLWKRFARYDKTNPGQAEVGVMHFAPNSVKDYDWGNKTKVKSRAHTWKKFPNLEGEAVVVDTEAWGKGDTRAHHMWWFDLLPNITGGANGMAHNWWKYIIQPETVR